MLSVCSVKTVTHDAGGVSRVLFQLEPEQERGVL